MNRAGSVFVLAALYVMFGPVEGLLGRQAPANSSPVLTVLKSEGASLKIRLRLPEDAPFLGTAIVRLLPSEGDALSGQPSELQGEFLFSNLKSGKYTVDVNAPGYMTPPLPTQVEPGHGQRTLFLVMEPRPVPVIVEKSPPGTAAETPGTPPKGASSLLAAGQPSASPERDYWKTHELEEYVPPVDPKVECPTQDVLKGVSQRMEEFVGNLEKFIATERVEHFAVDAGKPHGSPDTRKFEYMVTVSQNKVGTFLLEEYRDGMSNAQSFPEHVATNGLPALVLLFHPVLSSDFQFVCEGLGQWGGRAAWQIHFAQRADRQVRMRAYVVGSKVFGVQLEGRAWIDPGNFQVFRLESELAKPIPEIGLTKEHIAIEYERAQLHTRTIQIWLPREAELYVEKKHHQYYRRHTFSDFKVFNVDTEERAQAPKGSYSFTNVSEQDVRGTLTVVPEAGAKSGVVTLTFTVPARGRVFKVVGIGKDVNLALTEVTSATFAHNGRDGAIKVDADLARRTTLDVIPDTMVQ